MTFFPSYFEWWHIPVVFLAGLVGEAYGCVIGGGGIPIQAALVFVGAPIKSALASGSVGGLGTEAGVISETRDQITSKKGLTIRIAIPYTLGGILGVWLLLSLSTEALKYIMVVAVLVILAHAYYSKGKGKPKTIGHAQHAFLFLFMFMAGTYGAIGPGGEGAFSKFAIMSILGLSFIQSQGIKAAATVPSRVIRLVVTTLAGLVIWPYALTLVAGTFVGSKYATRVAKRIPDIYLKLTLAIVSVVFVIYLLFFYGK
jgi:uncharacterized protein